MRTERNIFIAFILNFAFSIFEFFGGIYTGSVAIMSDAVHDIGDAASIGLCFLFEKISKRDPDERYTYGYIRFSVLGSALTTLVLLLGSVLVIYHAIGRLISPREIHYDGMIVFAIAGFCVNFCAAVVTHGGGTLNQRAVNLHMLEDVLGWLVVLVGAVVIKFTNLVWIDPVLSVCVAVFILVSALRQLKQVLAIFLLKTPKGIDVKAMREQLQSMDEIHDVHHIHVWSIDGQSSYATMHVVTHADNHNIKEKIRQVLSEYSIYHVTLELELEAECCHEKKCRVRAGESVLYHHHERQ